MRLAVLDVGSAAVNLVVSDTDAELDGKSGLAASVWKSRTRLAECLESDGSITAEGRRRVAAAVAQAADEARRVHADQLFAYATAAVRDAPDADQVLDEVDAATGVRLGTLSGVEEAQLTFLAARRWLGWRAGPMLLLDIGGGTLEIAFGPDRLPASALSLPLGAGRLTREFLRQGDPPSREAVHELRRHVRKHIRRVAGEVSWESPQTAAATSTIFQQLARLTGAPPSRLGPFVDRQVRQRDLRPWIDRLAGMPARRRARLPGVSSHRARQIFAGAVVGYALMRELGVPSARVCPWGLREGVLLRRLETDQPPVCNAAWVPLPSVARVRGDRRALCPPSRRLDAFRGRPAPGPARSHAGGG